MSRETRSGGRRVCVIGAGVAGLVSAKVLKQDGFDVTLFEKDATLGGVWAPSRAYPGLRTNNPRETYAFSDYPYPKGTEDFPAALTVMKYLTSYAEHFGLMADLRLGTEVVSVSPGGPRGNPARSGFRVACRSADGHTPKEESHHFDFVVVCNGVFSEPHVPHIDGVERFPGAVMHSSGIRDRAVLAGKRVVVVGGGKSARDCAAFAAREGASSTLVVRTAHWMLPRYVGGIRVDRFAFLRVSVVPYYPAYHRAGPAERALRIAAAPLLWLGRRGADRLVARLSGIPALLVPDYPHVAGIENQGIGEELYDAVNSGKARVTRAAIASFPGGYKVRLDSGETLDADAVVFATGWRQSVPFLDDELGRRVRRADGRFSLYRQILPPREPRLGFIGYASSGNAPLTSEIAAHWLSEVFTGRLSLPREREMEREAARVAAWAARTFPRRNGFFIGAYVAQYVDELMRDMGLPTRRARSLLAEHLTPLWASRYAGVAAERHRS